jgi:hypothetical protein
MLKPYRKNQIRIAFGEFSCLYEYDPKDHSNGLLINFPLLDSPFTKERISDYIEFLKVLLKAKD